MSALLIQTTLSELEGGSACPRNQTATATPKPAHGLRHRHAAASTEAPTGKKSGLLLFVLLIAQLMVILDITAVNIALPSLAGDLDLTGSEHQLDDHELLAHLRQPAPLRRPRRRPARTTPDVPDRPRHLHRILVRLRDGRHRRCPLRRPRGPGSRRRDALPRSARDHHVRLPGQPAGEGARRLGRSRRRRCCDRRPRRRPPDRVHRLADDLLRQPPRRSRPRRRRTEDHPGRHSQAAVDGSRPPRRSCSPRRASARSSSQSPRPRVLAGLPPRLTCSASAVSPGSRPSRRSSAAPRHRSCGSSGWPTAQSAAVSS